MKKIKILMALILSIAVIFFIFIIFNKGYKNPSDIKRPDAISTSTVNEKVTDDCSQIIDINKRNECYSALAIKLKNLDFCRKISEREKIKDCEAAVNYYLAVDSEDATLCSKQTPGELKESCYLKFFSKNNSYKCDDLADNEIRDYCQDAVYFQQASNERSADLCEKISLARRRSCYYALFYFKDDLDFCDSIGAEYKIDCRDVISNQLAIKNVDKNFCDKISVKELQQGCYQVVSSLKKK